MEGGHMSSLRMSRPFAWRSLRLAGLASCILVVFTMIWFYHDITIMGTARPAIKERPSNPAPGGDQNKMPSSQVIPPTSHSRLIPPKIWQIMLPRSDDKTIDAVNLQDTPSWLALNPGYDYTLIAEEHAQDFVRRHFSTEPGIVETYNRLTNVGMRSDLLRYLVLDVEGGVYTDTDTVALRPIDVWVPAELRDQVRLIVGIEFDRRNGSAWVDIPHWLQFAQWTIAAAPGHPVFRSMVERVIDSVALLSEKYAVPVEELRPNSLDVMNSTGPAAWTDVVFEHLQKHDPRLETTKDLSWMEGDSKLFGDILVLNIDGFGMGQPHSNSTNNGTIPEAALMRHLFRGSWRDD